MAEDKVELFSVYQKFTNGEVEKVRGHVLAEEAVKAAQHYTTSVAAQMGITTQVLITDMMDLTVFEWRHGEGVVFPKVEEVQKT